MYTDERIVQGRGLDTTRIMDGRILRKIVSHEILQLIPDEIIDFAQSNFAHPWHLMAKSWHRILFEEMLLHWEHFGPRPLHYENVRKN